MSKVNKIHISANGENLFCMTDKSTLDEKGDVFVNVHYIKERDFKVEPDEGTMCEDCMKIAKEGVRFPNVTIELTSRDGHHLSILGKALRALKSAKAPQAVIDEFLEEAKSGDRDHLLQTLFLWAVVDFQDEEDEEDDPWEDDEDDFEEDDFEEDDFEDDDE